MTIKNNMNELNQARQESFEKVEPRHTIIQSSSISDPLPIETASMIQFWPIVTKSPIFI